MPRYTVPNTALGESYQTCGVEGVLATEHQLKQGVLTNGSYSDLVNNSASYIMTFITSTGDTSGGQVAKTPSDVFVQSIEAGKSLKGLTFSGIGGDTYYNIQQYYNKVHATLQAYPFQLEVFANARNHPFSTLTGKPPQVALWPYERELLTFSKECRAKTQLPRCDNDTYIRNQASIRAGTCITIFSLAEIKLADEEHRVQKNQAGRMASAIEYGRLTNIHVDPANPGVSIPAQTAEIARCNSQTW